MHLFYDISCKLKRHLEIHRPNRRNPDLYFIPVLHSYSHGEPCRLAHSPRVSLGVGSMDGEVIERVWSELEVNVAATQRQTMENRLDSISLLAEYQAVQNSTNFIYRLARAFEKTVALAVSRCMSDCGSTYSDVVSSNETWRSVAIAQHSPMVSSLPTHPTGDVGRSLDVAMTTVRKAAFINMTATSKLRTTKSKSSHRYLTVVHCIGFCSFTVLATGPSCVGGPMPTSIVPLRNTLHCSISSKEDQ
jgi:hypothetical protein